MNHLSLLSGDFFATYYGKTLLISELYNEIIFVYGKYFVMIFFKRVQSFSMTLIFNYWALECQILPYLKLKVYIYKFNKNLFMLYTKKLMHMLTALSKRCIL